MTETSGTLRPATYQDLQSVTFSQALEAGLTHSGWLVGLRGEKSGLEAVLASHSVPPERAGELKTRGTYGPLFGGSSLSGALQRSLASRLVQAVDANGSPEYSMTWKQWDMFAREPICRLAASGRRTSGNGCSGWPTSEANERAANSGRKHDNPSSNRGGQAHLADTAVLAGWPTPRMEERQQTNSRDHYMALSKAVELQVLGENPTSSFAETEKPAGYRLNPHFSRWLMGYPAAWLSCVDWETR